MKEITSGASTTRIEKRSVKIEKKQLHVVGDIGHNVYGNMNGSYEISH